MSQATPALDALGSVRRRSDLLPGLAFLAPFLLFLITFQYVPLGLLARDSLYSYSLLNPDDAEFVGGKNFIKAFTDPGILQSYGVTALFVTGMLVLVIPSGLAVAVFLDGRLPARAIVRVLVFLPVVTSAVVTSMIFVFMLGQPGLINEIAASVGIPPIPFLTSPTWALPSIIVMSAWQEIGLAAVLFLAGLQGIPEEVREAARVDGISKWGMLRRITIPLLSRSTLLIVVLVTVFGLQAFAPPLLMTAGGPSGWTDLITFNIYQTAFQLDQPGVASAISIVMIVAALAVSGVQMRLLRTRWNY
jgi:multiple sugar transport system permease protein